MPKKKATSRGRPPSGIPLTPNSKTKYNKGKEKKSRKRKSEEGGDSSVASPAARKSLKFVAFAGNQDRGRPPLRPDIVPMTEDELRMRRKELMKRRRKATRLSIIRSTSVSMRGDRQIDSLKQQ